jgi:hypothetical protein
MRKRWMLIAIILLLSIPLALLLRDFARDVFLRELWQVLWGTRILFDSLPQSPLWGLLLLILLAIAARSLSAGKKTPERQTGQVVKTQGQVQLLAKWIERASKGGYFRQSLAQYLAGLAWDVMAYRERTTVAKLKERSSAGRMALPPVIEAYLGAAHPSGSSTWGDLLSRLRERLGPGDPASSLDPALEKAVEFLEDQVGVEPLQGAQP